MSDLALYRKYRPSNFSEVIGQDHVVSVLQGSIKQGNIAHAYLLAGSRGIGKTSIARILAKELGTQAEDIYEIDGASNRGIDDIRELREGVRTLPFHSQYKVYIIDEVHMLTKEAFNALLKTLEEPPAHAIFILATTELHKVPETILSRCQTFTLKKPDRQILRDIVLEVAKKEGFKIDEHTAGLIALAGDGSFRDSLGVLQKVIGFSNDKKISAEEVEKIIGAPDTELVRRYILSLLSLDLSAALGVIKEASKDNRDIKFFAKLILMELRAALLGLSAPAMEKEILAELGDGGADFLKEIKDSGHSHYLSAILKEFLSTYAEIGRSFIPELPLELSTVRIFHLMKGEAS